MQKIIAVIAFIFIFSSCAERSKNELVVFKATEMGLSMSNEAILNSSRTIYMSLEQRSLDPRTSDHAQIWQEKAMVIKSLSDKITSYIGSLKRDLKINAGVKTENGREIFEEGNVSEVTHLFNDKDKGKELYAQLQEYEHDMLGVDSMINEEFKHNFISSTRAYPERNDFTKTFFDNIPVMGALTMLSKFENDARIMENRFVSYCHNRSSPVIYTDGFNITPLVSLSSNYVKAGDEIEITAGIGSFTTVMRPVVLINQKTILIKDNGTAVYKFRTPLKAGKYFVPIKIEFIKPDGSKGSMMKNLKYTVAE